MPPTARRCCRSVNIVLPRRPLPSSCTLAIVPLLRGWRYPAGALPAGAGRSARADLCNSAHSPYTPLVELKDEAPNFSLHLRGYALLFTDSLYPATYRASVKIAAISMVCCILIGYPTAYYIARSEPATCAICCCWA